jgi:hypothetical protein
VPKICRKRAENNKEKYEIGLEVLNLLGNLVVTTRFELVTSTMSR